MRQRTRSSKKYVHPGRACCWPAVSLLLLGAGLILRQIGEAYQILSDSQLRAAYDKYGKEGAMPSSGFGMRHAEKTYKDMALTRQQRIRPSSSP
jgi:curved DNA-binding protein CbpA